MAERLIRKGKKDEHRERKKRRALVGVLQEVFPDSLEIAWLWAQ